MKIQKIFSQGVAALVVFFLAFIPAVSGQSTREKNNEVLLDQLQRTHGLSEKEMEAVRAVFHGSSFIGQGNPAVTVHASSPEACQEKVNQSRARYENKEFERICRAKYMAPLYNPATERAEDAVACIDQFEFPNIPCVYPVVWVSAREAALICEAVGKRLCDAHEWEGACAGALEKPDYHFELAKGVPPNAAVERMRQAHNRIYGANKVWAYGPEYRKGTCACSSFKTAGCTGGSWTGCGSNTFPAGSFPDCRSPLGVFDLHGNAAEHMNLPLDESQMSSRGSKELGYTEMKGSWFIFDSYYAHPDWCRWRAPYWHGSRVMDLKSHRNYHLSFRCCKTVR